MSLKNFYFQDLLNINMAAVTLLVFIFLGSDAPRSWPFFIGAFTFFILIFKSSLNVKDTSSFSDACYEHFFSSFFIF